MPHNLLRVNTVFEVIHSAGGYTAYSEKRPAYEFLKGPSGTGLNDLYAPEIAFNNILGDLNKTIAFDQLRVQSVINEIDGKTHDGSATAPVPALFGMNFQSLNAAKKDDVNTAGAGVPGSGYADDFGTPDTTSTTTDEGGLQAALNYVDGAIGSMVAELKAKNLYNSTAIIITAKHAESSARSRPSRHRADSRRRFHRYDPGRRDSHAQNHDEEQRVHLAHQPKPDPGGCHGPPGKQCLAAYRPDPVRRFAETPLPGSSNGPGHTRYHRDQRHRCELRTGRQPHDCRARRL